MEQKTEQKLPAELWELRAQAGQVEELEKEWKIQRQELRRLAVNAVLDYGFSVVRAADIAGIQRKTLSVWLDVERAIRKERAK